MQSATYSLINHLNKTLRKKMTQTRKLSSSSELELVIVILGLVVACSACNVGHTKLTGKKPSGSTDSEAGLDSAEKDDCKNVVLGNNTFTGTFASSIDPGPYPRITVKALDNETGEELGPCAISSENGLFTLTGLPDGYMGLLAVGVEEGDDRRIDTYTYDVATNEQGRDVYSTPLTVAEMIDGYICGEARTDVGAASGAVYYYNEAGDMFEVDCATVEIVQALEDTVVYYFSSGLPSVGDQSEPCDREDIGAGRLLETSHNGRFYATNLPAGMVTLKAMVAGKEIGRTRLKIVPPSQSTGGKYNSIITRIYADEPGDPTPDCESE